MGRKFPAGPRPPLAPEPQDSSLAGSPAVQLRTPPSEPTLDLGWSFPVAEAGCPAHIWGRAADTSVAGAAHLWAARGPRAWGARQLLPLPISVRVPVGGGARAARWPCGPGTRLRWASAPTCRQVRANQAPCCPPPRPRRALIALPVSRRLEMRAVTRPESDSASGPISRLPGSRGGGAEAGRGPRRAGSLREAQPRRGPAEAGRSQLPTEREGGSWALEPGQTCPETQSQSWSELTRPQAHSARSPKAGGSSSDRG